MSKTKIHGISLPAELLDAGKARARRQGRSFSGHVRYLILNDLGVTHGHKSSGTGNSKRAAEPAG